MPRRLLALPRRSRRSFLRGAAVASVALAAPRLARAAASPALTLAAATIPDPDGHHAALRLKGDWLAIALTDGRYAGLGEISHSNGDTACLRAARRLFEAHVAARVPSLALLAELHAGPWATAPDFATATAISGLDQALHDLIARREGVPVWRLRAAKAVRDAVPCYLSLNRAMRRREPADFVATARTAHRFGVTAVKVTPFEAVTRDGDQLAQCAEGFRRIDAVRTAFPGHSLRVDCHERFTPATARALTPRFAALDLTWLEEPTPPGPVLGELRVQGKLRLAVGELFYGSPRFRELIEKGWADTIMPDPKHVGGFGPLVDVCVLAGRLGGAVSPHNPSGPIATCAALHAAALSPAVTCIELILTSDRARQPGADWLADGQLRIPTAPGWGLTQEQLASQYGATFVPIPA